MTAAVIFKSITNVAIYVYVYLFLVDIQVYIKCDEMSFFLIYRKFMLPKYDKTIKEISGASLQKVKWIDERMDGCQWT